MSIRVVCPSCHKVYTLDDTMQGKNVRCRACQSAIAIPGLAQKGGREGSKRPADERIATPSRPASAAKRASRDEDEEPPRRPAERGSRRENKNSRQGNNLVLILVGVGAAALVLIGLVVGGVFFLVSAMRGKSDQAAASNAPSTVAVKSKVDAPAAPPVAPANVPPAGNVPPAPAPAPAPVVAPPNGKAPPAPDFVPLDPPPAGNAPPAGLPGNPAQGGDLAALKGTWQSGPVRPEGGRTAGTVTLNISPQPGGRGGRIRVEIATKQGGRTTSSGLNYAFTLEQAKGQRLLVTHIKKGPRGTARGMVFLYRFEGGQLILSGLIASRRINYTLQNVPLRRTSTEPQMAAGGNPANPGAGGQAKGSPNALKFSGDVFAFVAEAVRDKRLADVDIRGFTLHKTTYRDVCAEGGVLIGFQVGLAKFVNKDIVKSWRPVYLTKNGEKMGNWQGPVPATPITLKAKSGYVVSELSVRTGLTLVALRLTYAKLGTNGLDLSDTYNSQSVGGDGGGPASIGGKGALFVGVTGHLGPDMAPSSLGMVAVLPKQ